MKIKLHCIILGLLGSCIAFADGYIDAPSHDQPWSVVASFGNGKYQRVHAHDGKTAIGRLALGNEFILTGDYALGFELGFQSGNHMRLDIPYETLAILGWLPARTTLGPMLDLLITAKSDPLGNSALFAQVKGGFAYRYWQIKQSQINDLYQIGGEFQAGFGYPISALASLNLLYQGVFGNDPNLQINPYKKTASVANIPILHAVLLGLSVNL